MSNKLAFIDTLYGDWVVDHEIASLLQLPVLQRLRHVRLSNIDSSTMPGIAALTRFEHVLGVGYLARKVGYFSRLSKFDQIALQAAGFLHDWAITAFGHLVEEAFSYAGAKFDHEGKLFELVMQESRSEIGGINRQIFCGRETGFGKWAKKVAGERGDELIEVVTNAIVGQGVLGRVISGDIDLDNIDNIARIAVHMGLPVDKELPVRLASSIVDLDPTSGAPVFSRSAESDVEAWLLGRSQVYERLMLAEVDFSGKLMIISAVVNAFRNGEITSSDWNLTDYQLVSLLQSSTVRECSDTIVRWLTGEYWDTSTLLWVNGNRPAFKDLMQFSESLTSSLGRHCFAYGIKDKRDRRLVIHFDDGLTNSLGTDPKQWLLGVGSSKKRPFSGAENEAIKKAVEDTFGGPVIGAASAMERRGENGGDQLCLL